MIRPILRHLLGALGPSTRKSAARYVEVLTAVGTVIGTVEILVRRRAYEDGKLLGGIRPMPRAGQPAGAAKRPISDLLRSDELFMAMQVARLAGAALILIRPPRSRTGAVAARLLVAAPGILHGARSRYGLDGADQLSNLTWSALTVFHAAGEDELIESACLWFITLQSSLAYLSSGNVKALSPVWRSGSAVPRIVRTRSYGAKWVWRTFDRVPGLGKATSRLVMVGEALFPLVFFQPRSMRHAHLAAMAGFHLAIAASMGLHRFWWAFVGTYPAVSYCAANWRGGRLGSQVPIGPTASKPLDNTLPVALGGLAVSATLLGYGYQRLAARRDRQQLTPLESFVEAGSRRVHFQVHAGPPGGPTVVLENGNGLSSVAWVRVVEKLVSKATVLTYDRAGTGWSDPAGGGEPLATYLNDLDLVLEASGVRRPAIFVGHSIGALFARYYQDQRPDAVAALVLVDGTHPHELERSRAKLEQHLWRQEDLRFAVLRTSLGLTRIAAQRGTARQLPGAARRQLSALLTTEQFWRGVRAEQALRVDELAPRVGTMDSSLSVPVTVIIAGFSTQQDPVHIELQEEFLKLSDRSRKVVIDNATTELLVLREEFATRVAEEILSTPAG